MATDGFDRYPSSCGASTASRARWTPRRRSGACDLPLAAHGLAGSRAPGGAPPLAQPEVLHLGRAAGKDRRGAAGPGGPGVVGGPPGAGARHRPPHPGAARLSFPGCVSGLLCVRCGRRTRAASTGRARRAGPRASWRSSSTSAGAAHLTPRALRSRPPTPGATRAAAGRRRARGVRRSSRAGRRSSTRLASRSGRACGGCSEGRGAEPDCLLQGPRERGGRRPRPLAPGEGRGLRLDRQRRDVPGRRRRERGAALRHLRSGVRARAQGGAAPRSSARGSSASGAATTRRGRCASGRATATAGTTATPP